MLFRSHITIGGGETLVAASSNTSLTGASRLNGVEERLLVLLGYTIGPKGHGQPSEPSANWTLSVPEGDSITLVETITATLVGILGFSEQLPVRVRVLDER